MSFASTGQALGQAATVVVSGPGWDEQIACLIAVAVVAYVLCDAFGAFDWTSETDHPKVPLDPERLSHENVLAHRKALARSVDKPSAGRVARVRKPESESKRDKMEARRSTSNRLVSPTIRNAANFVQIKASRQLSKPSDPNRMNSGWNTDDSSDDCAKLLTKYARCEEWIQRATLFKPEFQSLEDLTPSVSQSEAASNICSVTPADIVARWLL
mmetsp:Transcript_31020/g.50073  ORF Transcript_31020/g.50073 Transcript_31020/m.50073 type:complete len:214 (+) Transcript_31020:69-710(+)